MATGIGTATIDFGAAPGSSTTELTVTGQTAISATDYVEIWMQGDSTADHNAYEHLIAPILLRASDIVAGTSFKINAFSEHRLTGTFKVRWIWSS